MRMCVCACAGACAAASAYGGAYGECEGVCMFVCVCVCACGNVFFFSFLLFFRILICSVILVLNFNTLKRT